MTKISLRPFAVALLTVLMSPILAAQVLLNFLGFIFHERRA